MLPIWKRTIGMLACVRGQTVRDCWPGACHVCVPVCARVSAQVCVNYVSMCVLAAKCQSGPVAGPDSNKAIPVEPQLTPTLLLPACLPAPICSRACTCTCTCSSESHLPPSTANLDACRSSQVKSESHLAQQPLNLSPPRQPRAHLSPPRHRHRHRCPHPRHWRYRPPAPITCPA